MLCTRGVRKLPLAQLLLLLPALPPRLAASQWLLRQRGPIAYRQVQRRGSTRRVYGALAPRSRACAARPAVRPRGADLAALPAADGKPGTGAGRGRLSARGRAGS